MTITVPTATEFSALEQRVASLESGNSSSLQAQITEINGRVAALESVNPISIAAIDAAINAIDARVTTLEQTPQAAIGMTRLKTWDAGDTNVERFDKIYLTTGESYTYYALISVRVTGIQAGDEFDVNANFQVSNGSATWRMVGSRIVVGPTIDSTSTGTIEIAESQAQNFSSLVHHLPVQRSAYWKADQAYAELYFNLVVYSAHISATAGQYIQVDTDYGRMTVVQYR